MSKIGSIKTAIAGILSSGKNRLRYFSSGRAVLGVAIGLAFIAILFSFSRSVTAAGHSAGAGLLSRRRATPNASPAATPVPPPAQCEIPDNFIKFSKCTGKATDPVIIGGAQGTGDCKSTGVINVYVDQSVNNVGQITINSGSTLKVFDRTAQLTVGLQTTGIQVLGTLEIGNPQCPIGTINPSTEVKITFKGPKPSCDGLCPGYTKGIQVEAGGSLRLYGAKGVPDPTNTPSANLSWTYLSQPAGPATGYTANDGVAAPVVDKTAKTLQLAYDVSPATNPKSGWRKDDWIAVATTSFSPWETEFVRLAKDAEKAGVGSTVTVAQSLKFYHFGGMAPTPSQRCLVNNVETYFQCGQAPPECSSQCMSQPSPLNYSDPQGQNYGVDERAEVALISRSIKFTTDTPASGADNHWGGELKFIQGFAEVSIQGVEIQKFGKDQLGSYPIHFHMDGDLQNSKVLVNANSIDHSYNKCITVHSTKNLTFSNNVCARTVGHIFYEEVGDEYNITFDRNLGMGAMSNSFDVHETAESTRADLLMNYYWPGDNQFGTASFDQFNIFDTDNQFADDIAAGKPRVRGSCGSVNAQGKLALDRPFNDNHKVCDSTKGDVYFEPPSGFWIINPSTKLSNNSIAGCQDVGKAYWYVPPKDSSSTATKFIPIGASYSSFGLASYGLFQNNRGHGCYSGLYGEDDGLVTSDQLFGYQNGMHDSSHQPVTDEFSGLTIARISDRGVWLRPTFFVVKNGRVATSRDGVSLVTSGGVDGNYPGVWGLLQDSVVAGMSSNNVDRWGPCGAKVIVNGVGQVRGGEWGCIDQTLPKSQTPTPGGEFRDRGYASPDWPMFGFLIYDGPPLIVHDRFVNFRVAPGSSAPDGFTAAKLLTKADDCILSGCPDNQPPIQAWGFYGIPGCPTNPLAYSKYEGDAALGWFNTNPSSYPAATTTKQLTFTNVDLRHQIYTEQVNRGGFTDGDENTTILDLDGTLSGVAAADADGTTLPAISLNNLGVNASSNSVDECLAKGAEDNLREGRPTSGIVPSALGQIEFEMLYPPTPQPANNPDNFLAHRQLLRFTKNTIDFDQLANVEHHQSMPLQSRNGLGDWEPKVTNGYGYTVTAGTYPLVSNACKAVPPTENPGINPIADITLTDIVNAHVIDSTHPFYVQLGICYTTPGQKHPDPANVVGDLFTITKGYRSYGGGNVVANDSLKPYWGGFLACNGLDNQLAIKNGDSGTDTKTMPKQCPSASSNGAGVTTLTAATTYAGLTVDGKANGTPNLDKYFYDKDHGWLFLWVAQTEANAKGPSPLGNCKGDAMDPAYCPSKTTGDSYYVCPAQGCPSYRIVVNDGSYKPGASDCGDPYSQAQGYEWPAGPKNENKLVIAGTPTQVERKQELGNSVNGKFPFPHYSTTSTLNCPVTSP